MQKLEVAMLGQRGVGKTSLLTVMYDRFDAEIGQTDLQLIPDRATNNKLSDRLAELKTLTQREDSLVPGPGIAGGAESVQYTFSLARRGVARENAELELVFHDFPGGFLAGTDQQQSFVESLAERCAAILIPIDAPSLLEENGRWNGLTNNPMRLAGLLQRHLNENSVAGRPRLILLAPVKCEKYLDTDADKARLVETVRREYRALLRHLESDKLRPHVGVVITPVQTVGSVIFSKIEEKDGQPLFPYRRRGFDACYDPRDSEQILRYLLRFLLPQYLKGRWFSTLRDWLGWDAHFRTAAEVFGSGCRSDTPFCVVQGHDLLRL